MKTDMESDIGVSFDTEIGMNKIERRLRRARESATGRLLPPPLTLPLPASGERGRTAPRAPLPVYGERQGEGLGGLAASGANGGIR
jgi:hypothetical protein